MIEYILYIAYYIMHIIIHYIQYIILYMHYILLLIHYQYSCNEIILSYRIFYELCSHNLCIMEHRVCII